MSLWTKRKSPAKNVEKSLKDGAYTDGTYEMGNLFTAFPLPLLPPLPPLIDSMWTVCKFQNWIIYYTPGSK